MSSEPSDLFERPPVQTGTNIHNDKQLQGTGFFNGAVQAMMLRSISLLKRGGSSATPRMCFPRLWAGFRIYV